MTWQVGDVVGGYRIEAVLGSGGMATVYRAHHERLGRQVAIKVMHANFTADADFLARFEREARIVASLEHPNIVPVYDFDEDDGSPYLVMKYIQGETLKARFQRGAPTLTDIITLTDAIAGALDYAHQQGVLHRDVKPSNVILDANDTPYLTDFGLARMTASGDSTMSVGMIIGTPNYVSPEQASGTAPVTASTDVYSLGVMLFEMVVGRVPFDADTPYATIHKHIYEPPPLPSELNPEVPVQVEQVLLRALEKDPGQRYATPVELATAFKAAVDQAGLAALSPQRRSVVAVSPPPAAVPAPQPANKPKRRADDGADGLLLLLDGEESYANLPQPEIVRRRLVKRRGEQVGLLMHAAAFAVVNALIIFGSLTDGDFGPGAFVPLLGWGAGLAAHAVHYAFQTKRATERLYNQFDDHMRDTYSLNWRGVVAPGEINDQWDCAKKRIMKWEALAIHAAVYLMINSMMWVIWADDGGFVWPLIVHGAWGMGLLGHGLVTRYGKLSQLGSGGINAELAMMQNLGSGQVKRKNVEREGVRLTDEGEFTESMVNELEAEQRRVQR